MHDYIQLFQKKRLQSTPIYWNYSVSGKDIELKVLPSFEKEPEKYRIGVIQAGIVIQYFRIKFMNDIDKPLIQIFPSIMENELIAIFRFSSNENISKRNPASYRNKSQKKDLFKSDDLITLLELPKSSQLNFLDIPKNSLVLCSDTENPFIWLHTGYQAKNLVHQERFEKESSSQVSYILKSKAEQHAISSLLSESSIPQIVIFNYL